jgi:hypothetical protein
LAEEKNQIEAVLASSFYRFGLLRRVMRKDGNDIDLWSARDTLTLNVLTSVLARCLG